VPDAFDDGIIAKLKRAMELRDALQEQQMQLRADRQTTEYESRSNAVGDAENPIIWMEWVVTKPPEPLPLSFSTLLGDTIQNLRAALEYAVWAAADDVMRQTNPTQIKFPLILDAAKFATWRQGKSSWYQQPTLSAIDRAQPFHATAELMHPLLILQQLSNVDKHRLLNVVEYAAVDLGDIEIDPEPIVKNYTGTSGRVKVGDVIARVEFPRPARSGEIQVRGGFGWYESVAYEHDGETRPLRIDEMMNALCSFVVDTVTDLHIARKIERGEIEMPEGYLDV
jgi:hypothetical protein